MGFGVWLNVVCTLSVCGEKDFLGSTLAVRKRRFEGIWNDVSCIFDCAFALISISENCISIVEHVDCSIVAPLINFLGLERDS